MALELRQSLKLTQQVMMTPQLQQAIKLLQLSRMELTDLIRQEEEENPVLDEVAEPVGEAEPLEPSYESLAPAAPEKAREDDGEMYLPPLEWRREMYSRGSKDSGDEDDRPTFENFMTKKVTLSDHLLWQLRLNDFSEAECLVGTLIIGNLNEDGLLQAGLDEISAKSELNPEEVEAVLRKIQNFDPPGVGARDLRECLLIQARQLCPQEDVVQKILEEHLPQLARKNYQAIAKDLGVSLEEVGRTARLIGEMDPKPGLNYSDETTPYITPDVFVYKIGDEYVVVLNEDGLPKLRINPYYRDILREQPKAAAGGAKEYINDKIRSALWLIKSIHQRQRTVYRVTKSIVRFQREFLDKGIAYLKPMVLKDVAQDVEMHESTISRVTSNKYVHTPQGIFELKYFFNSSINTSRGENVSSESVKENIRQILGEEDPQKPYSDQELVEVLKKQEILIARRTVTKYREMLGVPPSTRRKQII
jgi:RNA polymerase sigma-54 factor